MRIMDALDDLLWVPFEFESTGASIVYYDQNSFSRTAMTRRDFYHLKDGQNTDAKGVDQAMQERDSNVIAMNPMARKRLLTV